MACVLFDVGLFGISGQIPLVQFTAALLHRLDSKGCEKMLKLKLLWILAFCLAVPNLASAQEPYEDWLRFFEGSWEWKSDNDMEGTIRFERVNSDVPALVVHFEMVKPQHVKSLAVSGWDAEEQAIVETGYNSAGANGQTRHKIVSSDTLESEWNATERDGTVRNVKYRLKRVDDNSYELLNGQANGANQNDDWSKITVQRKKEAGPDYQHLKAMEWMIGEWEGRSVVQEGTMLAEHYPVGAKLVNYNCYSWMQNKNYIGLHFRDAVDGKVVHEGFEIIGWDREAQKPVHWLYSVLGGSGVGEWSKDGETWVLDWSYTTGKGGKLTGKSYLTPVDEETHTWQIRDATEGGQETADTQVVIYRRLKQ